MNEINFCVNSRLDIVHNETTYRSSIQDMNDSFLAISIPIKESRYVALGPEDDFEVIYYKDDSVYKFQGKVIERRFEKGVPQILIEYPTQVEEIQRREYVRINITQYVKYIKLEKDLISESAIKKLNLSQGNKGLLIDLSGGGFKLKIFEDISVNDIIVIDIPDENGNIRVKSKVVRVGVDGDKKLICGLFYTDIDDKTRERIIRLIFSIMRKQRKTV